MSAIARGSILGVALAEIDHEAARHALNTGVGMAFAGRLMDRRKVIASAMGGWFLEASVLVAVLPVVDQVVSQAGVTTTVAVGSLAISLITFAVGVYFRVKGGE